MILTLNSFFRFQTFSIVCFAKDDQNVLRAITIPVYPILEDEKSNGSEEKSVKQLKKYSCMNICIKKTT